ncbi:MAG: hypothetical protein V8S26_06545 [Lachnospiraceae bacterium]
MQKKSRLPDEVQRAKERAFAAIEKRQEFTAEVANRKHRAIRSQAGTKSVKNADVKRQRKSRR